MPTCLPMPEIRLVLLTLGLTAAFSVQVRSAAADTKINASSTGPGQWVAHLAEPLTEAEIKPFIGRYLLSGQWPEGVTRPDDPKLLLDRSRLGAARIVLARLEAGGRIVRLTTDPVVSPQAHSLTIGKTTVSISFQGLAARLGDVEMPDMGPKIVVPGPMDRSQLASLAAIDPRLKELATAWANPGQALQLAGWLRLAPGEMKLKFTSGREFTIEISGEKTASKPADGGLHEALVALESAGTEMELKLGFAATKKKMAENDFFAVVDANQPNKPLLSENFLVSWAPEPAPEATIAIAPPPYELKGGNAAKGKMVFYSEAAKCSACHTVEGQGGRIGPDLTALSGKSPELVFHHINTPSDRIHPGYPSFTVALKSGQVAMGVVRSIDENTMEIQDTDAKTLKVQTVEIEELRPSTSSVMPSGLAGTLGEPAMRDLLEFLVGPRTGK